jgi:2-polyprenyl-6-methoxyphenol hydroxylase-like FAD-dependent oxidoreductase
VISADPASRNEKYEIHRDDLLDILLAAVADQVDIVFGRSVAAITDGPDGVAVTFSDGVQSHYNLVFGCDGSRSKTRRLAFSEADEFSHFLGGYFFIKIIPETNLLPANVSEIFSVPGRTALLNGYTNQTDIALAFRSDSEIAYDYRDRAQQRRMVHAHFDDLDWKVPAILAHLDDGDDFYFDKLNQVRMPLWSSGRIVLVGDAGYCVSPVAGMGGSMAIIGAARLADALRRHGDDHANAFQEYYDKLHPLVTEVQGKAAIEGMAMMFPSDDVEMAERDRRISEGALDI